MTGLVATGAQFRNIGQQALQTAAGLETQRKQENQMANEAEKQQAAGLAVTGGLLGAQAGAALAGGSAAASGAAGAAAAGGVAAGAGGGAATGATFGAAGGPIGMLAGAAAGLLIAHFL